MEFVSFSTFVGQKYFGEKIVATQHQKKRISKKVYKVCHISKDRNQSKQTGAVRVAKLCTCWAMGKGASLVGSGTSGPYYVI